VKASCLKRFSKRGLRKSLDEKKFSNSAPLLVVFLLAIISQTTKETLLRYSLS